ncbi:MAG: Transposase [Candidatus Methanosuratincola subterraneus]|uniref:Transposase n=1 Tax=Methanosuratincola subterraneus TaxID=2593994 RepID=A0A3S3RYZ8_METS7|nr:IS256 family transposase [Bacillota bacterium]RWX72695.1 MAG: Transposase [Candidatus Methanosuratincola subterraneus]
MAQYQVTVDGEVLQQLFVRDDALARLVEQVVNQVLEAQVTEQLKAGPYERTDERQGYRNGHRERSLTTRIGRLTLEVPRTRAGKFSTDLFERYQRSEQALILALMEMVINGVSTRKVRSVVEELCGTELSRSTVSDLCKRLDPVVREWNERDLSDREYPFVVVDALVIKVRKGGRVRVQSVLLAAGINREGYREILGLMIGDSESEASWSEFFGRLKARGLRGVDMVVSDEHKGLVKAIMSHFQGATWQRCQTHFMRNILEVCPKALQKRLHSRLRYIFDAPDIETARRLKDEVAQEFGAQAPRAIERLEAGFEDAMGVMALPESIRRRLRTTNGIERLNREVRRRERVVGIFPNEEAAQRLIGAVVMEIDEEWTTGHKYLDMTEYWAWRQGLSRKGDEKREGEMHSEAA